MATTTLLPPIYFQPRALLSLAKQALITHLACGFQRDERTGRYPSPHALMKHHDYVRHKIGTILRLVLPCGDNEMVKTVFDRGRLPEALAYWADFWRTQLLIGPWDCSSKFQTAQRDVDARRSSSRSGGNVTPFTEPRSGCYKLKQDPLSVRWGGSIISHEHIDRLLAGLLQYAHSCRHLSLHHYSEWVSKFRAFVSAFCCHVPGSSGDSPGKAQYGCCGGLRFRPAAWADQALWDNAQRLCLTPYYEQNHRTLAILGQHAPISPYEAGGVMLAAPLLSQRKRGCNPEQLMSDRGGGGACELCLMDAWTTNGTLRDVRLLYHAFDPYNKFCTLDGGDHQHVPQVKLLCIPEVEIMLKGYYVSNEKLPPPRDTRFGPLATTTIHFNSE